MGARAGAIRCRYTVVEYHDNLIGIGDLADFAPVGGKEIAIVKHDGVDVGDNQLARHDPRNTTRAREIFSTMVIPIRIAEPRMNARQAQLSGRTVLVHYGLLGI